MNVFNELRERHTQTVRQQTQSNTIFILHVTVVGAGLCHLTLKMWILWAAIRRFGCDVSILFFHLFMYYYYIITICRSISLLAVSQRNITSLLVYTFVCDSDSVCVVRLQLYIKCNYYLTYVTNCMCVRASYDGIMYILNKKYIFNRMSWFVRQISLRCPWFSFLPIFFLFLFSLSFFAKQMLSNWAQAHHLLKIDGLHL